MTNFATTELEMKGLAWVKFDDNMNISGTISRFVEGKTLDMLKEILDLKAMMRYSLLQTNMIKLAKMQEMLE